MNTEARKRARAKWREKNKEKEQESKRQWKLRNRARVNEAERIRQQRPRQTAYRRAYMKVYNKKKWDEFVALPEDFKQTIRLVKLVKQKINGLKRTENGTIQRA